MDNLRVLYAFKPCLTNSSSFCCHSRIAGLTWTSFASCASYLAGVLGLLFSFRLLFAASGFGSSASSFFSG